MREGTFDPTLRKFTMGNAGIAVDGPFEGVEAILSGTPHEGRPAAASPGTSGEALSAGDPGQPHKRMATILIVDDEFAIVDLLEMVLVDEGHHVLTAANGRQVWSDWPTSSP